MSDLAFPDHEYLTVKELAELLRLKERKIYDLAASGAVPCSKATGKLLFPAAEIRTWIEQATTGSLPLPDAQPTALPPIVLGSHDPLLDWAIRQSGCGLATFYDGSLDGLTRFTRGEGLAAGLHIHDAATGGWNVPAVSKAAARRNAVLVSFATRQRGLVFRAQDPAPKGIPDLAGRRVVPRQPGSGTDTLFRELARKHGLNIADLTLTEVARTEDEAAEAVRRGDADIAFGLQAAARSFGLEFLPVIDEQFALLVDRKSWFDPPLRKLVAFFGTQPFATRAKAYGGYDAGDIGSVLWNA